MDWDRPTPRFLAYLGRLAEACLSHDRAGLDKLLRLRMASHLPRIVLDETEYFRRARAVSLRAPLRLMQYLHQMRQLASTPVDRQQLTLPLRAHETLSAQRPRPRARRVRRVKRR